MGRSSLNCTPQRRQTTPNASVDDVTLPPPSWRLLDPFRTFLRPSSGTLCRLHKKRARLRLLPQELRGVCPKGGTKRYPPISRSMNPFWTMVLQECPKWSGDAESAVTWAGAKCSHGVRTAPGAPHIAHCPPSRQVHGAACSAEGLSRVSETVPSGVTPAPRETGRGGNTAPKTPPTHPVDSDR